MTSSAPIDLLSVLDLLELVDRLHAIRPLSLEETASLLGVSWSSAPPGPFGPGPFESYMGSVALDFGRGITGAELRLPSARARATDGLLIVDLDPERWDVPIREIRNKLGSGGKPLVPTPAEPPGTPIALCYTSAEGPFEELRFCFRDDCLVGLVVDRISSAFAAEG